MNESGLVLTQGYWAAVILGYLLGSLPSAYWLCLAVYKVNIFEVGSKNMGATNVHRSLGAVPFAITLILDILKGVAAVVVAASLAPDPSLAFPLKLTAGATAVIGHSLSFWVGFRGGKGVATGLGVFLALAPVSSVCAMGVFLIVLVATGFVSLGSIAGAALLPVFIAWFREGGPDWYLRLVVFASALAAFIIFRHRANLVRLLHGQELALGKNRDDTQGRKD